MRKYILFFLLGWCTVGFSQNAEVATVMSYNLLNYRNETSFCTNTNNNPIQKEGYLKTILQYVAPDLLICNEIGANPSNAIKILDRCLNVDGESRFEMASFHSNSNLANAVYYNGEMFGLLGSDQITQDLNSDPIVRLIDVYYLYYKEPNLALGADTTYLTVFAAHFKAGNTSSDKTDRGKAAKAVMNFIENKGVTGNYLIAGDFNSYTSSEAVIQELINPSNTSISFIDPVNRLGAWNNNPAFAEVHTQSTHYNSNGCASGGGLDDRFDFILISDALKNNGNQMDYVNNSYKAVANDGNHFNNSINVPANTSVPANVLDAIYEMSDHLPVKLDIIITESAPNSIVDKRASDSMRLISPSGDGIIGEVFGSGSYTIQVLDLLGRVVCEKQIFVNEYAVLNLEVATKGFAIVKLTDVYGNSLVQKVLLH